MNDLDKAIEDYITLDFCGCIDEEHSIVRPKTIDFKTYKCNKKKTRHKNSIDKLKICDVLSTILDASFVVLKIFGFLGALLLFIWYLASTDSSE